MWFLAYERFQRAIAREASRIASRLVRSDPHFHRRFLARFRGETAPLEPLPLGATSDPFYLLLLSHFSEITTSWDALRLLPQLVCRRPPAFVGEKSSYLRFFLESYVQEVYILSERLIAFSNRLDRVYRKDDPATAASLRELSKATRAAFKPMRALRGKYVHVSRNWDQELQMLATVELVSAQHPSDFASILRAFQRAKRAWMQLQNTTIHRLLGQFFLVLCERLLHKNTRFRVPRSFR